MKSNDFRYVTPPRNVAEFRIFEVVPGLFMVGRILVFQAFLWATQELERSLKIGMSVNILNQHLYVEFSRWVLLF